MTTSEFPNLANLSPEFVLSQATTADIEDAINCHHAAFDSDKERFWWPSDLHAMRVWQRGTMERNMLKSQRRCFKISHVSSGQLVAWTAWKLPEGFKGVYGVALGTSEKTEAAVGASKEVPAVDEDKSKEEEGLTTAEKVKKTLDELKLPEGSSKEGLMHAIMTEEECHGKHNIKEKILLVVLCTHPEFERKGLAKALVQPMLALADAEGVPVWVDSSPKGRGFYLKLGFEFVEVTEIDLSKGNKGPTGTDKVYTMNYEPKHLVQEGRLSDVSST